MQSDTDNPMANIESTNNTRWDQIVTQTASDFAENTTLNGLKYMAEKGATILERLFWISTFILSTVLCVFMVHKAYVKYDTSGVVVTLREQLVSVNEYPFPAVTICPQAKIRSEKYNYSHQAMLSYGIIKGSYENWSVADLRKFHSMQVFCGDNGDNGAGLYINSTIDIGTFFEVAPSHEDIFLDCRWRNNVNCLKSFRPVLTADGICYTFNILATNEIFRKDSVFQEQYYLNTSTPQKGWSLEKNYISYDNKTFPRSGRANGAQEDLSLTLKEVLDREFLCDWQTRPGYKVYLHHPADLPQASLHSYAAQPGKTTSLAIKLDILDTNEELVKYAPEIRQCYFPNEKYLQFFQKYTSSNCHLECLTNYTINICGCASFYMPRNNGTDICKAHKWQCIQEVLDEYAAEEDLNDGETSQCQCLPSCEDVNYDADVILTKLDLKEYDRKEREFLDLLNEMYTNDDENDTITTAEENTTKKSISTFTEIKIYYRRPRFVAMERSEMVGLSQFLADIGGTLGLFLGFSFLTLAEIFYFFTFKMYYSFRRQNSAKKDEESRNMKNI